tara:strand:- start:182 stop:397 length:216 start_codon:yes stop_codon:yes gene_type:complete
MTSTQVRKFLNSCKFNPKTDIALKFAVESKNSKYCEIRAREYLQEDGPYNIQKAIQLLTISSLLEDKCETS